MTITLLLALLGCFEHPEHVRPDDPTDVPQTEDVGQDFSDLVYYDCISVEFRQWGDDLDRCRIEMGFVSADDASHDGDRPPAGDGPEREEFDIGECRVEIEAPPEPDGSGSGGPGHGPAGPSTGIDVGATLTLRSDTAEVVLSRYNPDEGGVLYQLDGCDESTFPFGEVMDLVVEGSEASGMPAFTLDDAVWFPGRSGLLAPTVADPDGLHACGPGEDLELAWADDDPTGSDIGNWMHISVETSDGQRERLSCPIDPSDASVTVPAEALEVLTWTDDDPDARHDLRLGRTLESPETALPWGGTMRARVNWELWGDLELTADR